MEQRVGIAQALIGNPKVIIFDEPTVGLDPKQIIEVRNLLRSLGKSHTVILSTHILQEVQAVCDRIIIINKGKIVADEQTENISRAVNSNRRFQIKVCGPQREVYSALKSRPGIIYVEQLPSRDGDAYIFNIESEAEVDIRKSLFYMFSEKNWPLVGLEPLGMSLEDVFVAIVDQSAPENQRNYKREKQERARGKSPRQARAEQEMAKSITQKKAEQDGGRYSSLLNDEDDD